MISEKKKRVYSYAYVKGIVTRVDEARDGKAMSRRYSVDILPEYRDRLYREPGKWQTYHVSMNDGFKVGDMPRVGDVVNLRSLLTKVCGKFNPMKAMIVKEEM